MQKIIRNMVKCIHCGEVIESTYTHDFVTCKCGKVSVDGGKSYLKRCFHEKGDYEELSVTENIED